MAATPYYVGSMLFYPRARKPKKPKAVTTTVIVDDPDTDLEATLALSPMIAERAAAIRETWNAHDHEARQHWQGYHERAEGGEA